jgi:hypothetical protein
LILKSTPNITNEEIISFVDNWANIIEALDDCKGIGDGSIVHLVVNSPQISSLDLWRSSVTTEAVEMVSEFSFFQVLSNQSEQMII